MDQFKIQVVASKERNMFGRKSGMTKVEIVGTGWEHTDKGDASEISMELHKRLKLQHENELRRHYRRAGNMLFVLFYADGWQYDMVRDESPEKYPSSCSMGRISEREALETMMRHVKQVLDDMQKGG